MVEIRGLSINGSIAALKKRKGDQVYNDVVSQLDEQSRQLFEAPILDVGWYSLDSFLTFLEQDIKLTANGDANVLATWTGDLNEQHLRDIYAGFIESESPQFFIRHVAIIHQLYFRGVSIQMKFDGSNKAIITFTGFEKQHKLIEPIVIGFYRKVLEIAGVKDMHAQYLTSIEENKGYCELEITWM